MSQQKNTDIEVLRGVAIAFTLFNHLSALLVWHDSRYLTAYQYFNFWGGVDLFFCISGFIITATSLSKLASLESASTWQRLRFFGGSFWLMRALRLWPSALLWVLIPLACSHYLNQAGVFGSPSLVRRDAVAGAFHFANVHWLHCMQGSGKCEMGQRVLGPYWSLSLEEQFYLVMPFLLTSLSRRWLIGLLCIGVLAQLPLDRPPWASLWAVRTDALMLGMLIALVPRARQAAWLDALARWRLRWPINVLLMLALARVTHDALRPYANTGMLALLCALMVWLASHDKRWFARSEWAMRIGTWWGARSYVVYLVHMPVIAATKEAWWRLSPPGTVPGEHDALRFLLLAAVLLLATTECTHRFVEQPCRRVGRRWVARWWARRAPRAGDAAAAKSAPHVAAHEAAGR